MGHQAADLAHRLARDAEAVCRHYLSNGRREGRYWLVGDVRNTPGRSLFVRLHGPESGKGAAGKFTDAATGEHGDLLDIIHRPTPPILRSRRSRLGRNQSPGGALASVTISLTSPMKHGAFSACHDRTRRQTIRDRHHQHRQGRLSPHGGSSQCPSRFRAQSQKRIYDDAALRLCTEPQTFVSIHAATTGRIPTRRPRPGRR
jgi:hypothetical protein